MFHHHGWHRVNLPAVDRSTQSFRSSTMPPMLVVLKIYLMSPRPRTTVVARRSRGRSQQRRLCFSPPLLVRSEPSHSSLSFLSKSQSNTFRPIPHVAATSTWVIRNSSRVPCAAQEQEGRKTTCSRSQAAQPIHSDRFGIQLFAFKASRMSRIVFINSG